MNRRGMLCALATLALQAVAGPDVSGKWHFVLQTEGGERVLEPTFRQDGEKVTGKWQDNDIKGTFTGGKLVVEFRVSSEEAGPGVMKLKGELAGDALEGEWSFQEYQGTFRATRLQTEGSPAPGESHHRP